MSTYDEMKQNLKGYRTYFIHFNGGRPLLVYIKENDVKIFKPDPSISNKDYSMFEFKNKWIYIILYASYKATKIFIGKSPKIKMTEFSGDYGKYFNGNTILLKIKNDKYVLIGYAENIKEFTIKNDEIKKYYSPVGNNDVPYPLAIGEKNIYFFLYPEGYISKDNFSDPKDLQTILDEISELRPFINSFTTNKPINKMSLEKFREIKSKPLKDITLSEIKQIAKMFNVTVSGSKKDLANRIKNLRKIKISI